MKKLALLGLAILMSTINLIAQNQKNQSLKIVHKSISHNGIVRCSTMEADSILRVQHPELGTLADQEAWLQQKIQEHKKKYDGQQKLPILTIPVVVHVIHNGDPLGSGENILDGQVQSQIQVLNEDYRRILGTPGYNNNSVGSDIEIEFCMAVVDPSGNPTNGIDRVNYGMASFNTNADVETMKTTTIWDPTQYMNMWTVRFGGGMAGTLGYAQFPDNSGLPGMPASGGAANTDGVVSSFDAMGSVNIFPGGTYNATYNQGRTMTHEVGHWLGLRHIWGDGPCGTDDFCADTPESDASNFGCPTGHVSCGTTDMIENYMDYTDDACMNIFTLDQKTRMRTVMDVSPRRMELKNSTKCTPPNPEDGGISAIISPSGLICGSLSFTPQVTLTNYGNNDITSIDIVYDIDGVGAQTFNWTGTLTPGASVNVTLPLMTTTAGTHTFNASTNLPNGNADSNTANDGTSISFTTQLGNAITITINTDCWGYETYWELLDNTNTVIGFGGNTGTNILPGGGQTAAAGDAGAYPNLATVTINGCLANSCYDFVIYDDWGDGIQGGSGCAAGTYGYTVVEDATGNTLASGGAFTNSETTNFCLGPICTTNAGTMNTTAISLCGNGAITATHNADETLDANDVLQFVLHTGSGTTLGTVISTSNTPSFTFGAGMTYGTTYYISAIAGNDDGTGAVDLSNPCLSVAAGTPVIWNALPTVTANASATTICAGQSVTLTGGGATSYTWDNGVTDGVAFNPTTTTTYTVTGTDANGCTNTANVTVTVNPLPNVTANASSTTICTGQSVTLTGGGATSYTWDNGVTDGVAFNPTTTTTYTVTGTDANGCTNTANVTVTVNPLPVISNITHTCNGTNTAYTLSFDVTGGSVSYTVTGLTGSFTGSTWTSTPIISGNSYNVTVTDANGCSPNNIIGSFNCSCTTNAGTMNTTALSLCGNGAITATHNADETLDANDVLQFALHTGNGTTLGTVISTSNTPSFTFGVGMTYGTTYYISAIAGNDDGTGAVDLTDPCLSVTAGTPVVWNALPTVTANASATTICAGQPVTLTGGGATSYTWDNGVTDGVAFNPTATTTYTVTGTDANGCTNTANVTVTVNPLPNVTANASATTICAGQPVTLTGGGATSYTWYNGVTDGVAFNPTDTATYTVTGTDANGCTNTANVTVTVNPLPVINNITLTDATCGNSADGQISVSASGNNLTYSINGGTPQSSNVFTNLQVGNHTVEVLSNGCSVTQSVTINSPAPIIYNFNHQLPICSTDGYISLLITGGNSPYSVQWQHDTNLITDSININSTGQYIFTITDANSCSLTDTIILVGPGDPTIIIDLVTKNVSCDGLSDGEVIVNNISGGVEPYSYQWDNGVNDNIISNLNENIYQVTITDANGCIGTATAVVGVDNNDCLDIHNAISPNGDGENDSWEITGIQGKTNTNVKVFNRWGSLIFESDNYQNDWKGTYKGKDLPAGIYYYIVTIDGDSFEGSLTIIR